MKLELLSLTWQHTDRVLARKKLKGVVLISKDICGFSGHIKYNLHQKGGGGGGGGGGWVGWVPPSLARSLTDMYTRKWFPGRQNNNNRPINLPKVI